MVALFLAPTLGVACGDPSLSSGLHQQRPPVTIPVTVREEDDENFSPVPTISIVEHSMWCATLKVGGVIEYDTCMHSDWIPTLAYADYTQRLMMLIVRSGETITFVEGGYARLLTTTDHWVVAQLSRDTTSTEVRFTLTSGAAVRKCLLTTQLFMRCTQ